MPEQRAECRQVWNNDRKENQWHLHWSCSNVECGSPFCTRIRQEHGVMSALHLRKMEATGRQRVAIQEAGKRYGKTMHVLAKTHGGLV